MAEAAGTAVDDGSKPRLQRVTSQPENPFFSLVSHQQIAIIPTFTLESGATLHNVPLAYSTRGTLSPTRDNAMVICHALTGSADVSDWWGPLLGGPGRAFDVTRFFIICMNSLGSPYGTASPVTNKDGDPEKGRYGPEFPLTTIRDDVNLHKILLDDLGIRQIAAVIGGSMGGMLVLEWAYFGKDYVRCIVPIATSSQHSAWGISWGEAQRQSIYSDPKYDDGYYPFDDPPSTGLAAARMSALLTYRSRDSFESRFGRNAPDPSRRQNINGTQRPQTPTNEHWAVHNEGHRNAKAARPPSLQGSGINTPTDSPSSKTLTSTSISTVPTTTFTDPQFSGARPTAVAAPTQPTPPPLTSTSSSSSSISSTTIPSTTTNTTTPSTPSSHPQPLRSVRTPSYFSAQSYLRYQGQKFVSRFDSNCYIAITRKLDTHDLSRPHHPYNLHPPNSSTSSPSPSPSPRTISTALSLIPQPALIIGIHSDGLFTIAEQRQLAEHIPSARLEVIDSPEGHDAFLLQFEQVNRFVVGFLREVLGDIVEKSGEDGEEGGMEGGRSARLLDEGDGEVETEEDEKAEVEDITAW
ncbi:MAG: homoserine O- acetyltransferase [Caeruleum heppii]|nr:MAG: homoserine O- acetyltransferase [Caeruleum heppii]